MTNLDKAKEVLERLEALGNTTWQSANSVLSDLQEILDMASTALDEVKQVEQDFTAFYEYWANLYGTGLEIANWHQNDDTEPYDNFFDEAEKELRHA